jgi:DNA polymerase III subunit delta
MPEIKYKEFENHLKKLSQDSNQESFAQACLIYGEELLCKKSFESLIEKLLPGDAQRHNFETVDGAKDAIYDAVNSMNTYSLLSGPKVVAVPEARIFYGKQENTKLLNKAKEAYERDNKKKAGQYIKSLLEQLQLTFEDVSSEDGIEHLIPKGSEKASYDWLKSIVSDAIAEGLQTSSGGQPETVLQNAIEKGFPKGNYLVLTTDLVDKRRSLFKIFKTNGFVIDCSVPKGNRKVDRMVQEEVLRDRMQGLLKKHRKSMDSRAFFRLYEMTGFDLRTFSNNLEKLILYVGERPNITSEDIEKTLSRTKLDPIYEFTNAVSDRNLDQALSSLSSLFSSDIHPLQIFTAVVNHFRKVLMAKSFVQSQYGRSWQPGIPFNVFKTEVLSHIPEYDQQVLSQQEAWHQVKTPSKTVEASKAKNRVTKKPKKKSKQLTDMMVAPNPNNPYPIYQMLKKSDNFTMDQLFDLYSDFNKADMELKRSGQTPSLILEKILFRICVEKNKKTAIR